MAHFESFGNGSGGRVDSSFYIAGYFSASSVLFGTLGEALQSDALHVQGMGQPLPRMTDFVNKALVSLANMPYDSKAVGVGLAVAGSTQLVHGARAMRDIKIENGLIGAGISPESAIEPVYIRALKRLGSWAIAGAAGVLAYKGGEHLSMEQNLLAGMGAVGAGTAYLMNMNKRLSGRWFGEGS